MKLCSVPDCGDPVKAKGLCNLHYQRKSKGLNLDLPKRFRSILKTGWLDSDGYRHITTPDGREVREHRYVMEKKLGRKLAQGEDVHHVDENKSNNDPSNLELKLHQKHTSDHRPHRMPCLVCGYDDVHGSHGLCACHAERAKQFLRDADIKIPDSRLITDILLMGVAWSTESKHVRDRLTALRRNDV